MEENANNSSDDDNLSDGSVTTSFSTSDDEQNVDEVYDNYAPEVDIQSDEDRDKCHTWSRTQSRSPYEIEQGEHLPEYGRPVKTYDASILPH